MKTRTFLTILFSISFAFTYAQNEKTNREEYTLKLPIDGARFYEHKVQSSPYFIKGNELQIYPGEKLYIEVDENKGKINSMKVVRENFNTEKTIEIEFTQTIKNKKSESMILKIVNPFEKNLEYKAKMFIVDNDQWIDTNVLPIKAKSTGYKNWSEVIITIVLSDWELK